MNKKIFSFVLAMVLSAGFGCSSLFASYSDYADEFNSFYSGKTASGSVKVQIGSKQDNLKGNLTGLFGYYAGTMISYQQVNGQFTVYDSFGARATLSNSGENFKVTGFNPRTSDLVNMPNVNDYVEKDAEGKLKKEKVTKYYDKDGNEITKAKYDTLKENERSKGKSENYVFKSEAKKKEFVAAMKAFLLGIGFTEEQLSVAKTDVNGNLLGVKSNGSLYKVKMKDKGEGFDGELARQFVSADWLVKLASELEKGVNHSAQISLGNGVSGPNLTLFENGKARMVYGMDAFTGEARPTTLYVYDNDGFQIGVETAKFEVEKTKDGYALGKWTTEYTAITYDSEGVQTETTYRFLDFTTDPVEKVKQAKAAGNLVRADKEYNDEGEDIESGQKSNKDKLENGGVLVISKTTYTSNNSKEKTIDYTTNNTTWYSNGKAAYTKNAEGAVIGRWEYYANGAVETYYNAKGKDNKGNTVGTTTVYDEWGRELFTAATGATNDLTVDKNKRAALIKEYYDGITNTNGGFKDNTKIVSFYIYADYADSVLQGRTIDWGSLGYTQNDVKNMMNFNNGVSALCCTTIDNTGWEEDSGDTANINTASATGKYTRTSASYGSHNQWSTYSRGKKYSGKRTYNNTIFIGGSQAYSKQCRVADTVTTVDYIETDPAVEGEMWSAEPTDKELEAAMKKAGISKKDKKAIEKLKKKLAKTKLEAKAKELGIDINDEEAMEDLRNGFYTDSNGQTYAIVNANSVNIMDGEGFHSAEGETILVAVDKATKNSIINKMKSTGDRSIMFMGDVRESVNGYLTIAMNTSYGGGYVQGSVAVQSAKKEIAETSMKVAAARYAYENGEISEQEYNNIVKDAGWVGKNTDTNLQKYANGNFSWDNNKTSKQNLRDAFRVLVNF